jgi:flagellar P-ring protein FlgI
MLLTLMLMTLQKPANARPVPKPAARPITRTITSAADAPATPVDTTPLIDDPARPNTTPPVLALEGHVEAPTQPTLESQSNYTRSPRFAPLGLTRPAGNFTTPVSSLAAVRGQEDNVVLGVGLVTGLAGSGDSIDAAKLLLRNMLLTRNINIDMQQLSSKNIAIVQVEATIVAGIKPGRHIDITVSTIGDASSLQGGTLLPTELTDMSGRTVYATASGPLTVGGFSIGGDGASAKKNMTTIGTLPGGGKVEREVPTTIVSEHGFVYLDLKSGHDSFGNVVNITGAINALFPRSAEASTDGKSVRVAVPPDLPESEHAAFVHALLSREIVSENPARVIVNERTGVIVMGGEVRLRPGAIAQGAITVTIAESPQTSQPGPLSNGTTRTTPRTNLNVNEADSALVLIPGAVTLQEVVDVLNVLGTTPRDLISILEAMAQGGLLEAEIRRM